MMDLGKTFRHRTPSRHDLVERWYRAGRPVQYLNAVLTPSEYILGELRLPAPLPVIALHDVGGAWLPQPGGQRRPVNPDAGQTTLDNWVRFVRPRHD